MAQFPYLDDLGLGRVIQNIKSSFSKINHTHEKADITDFPTIPTKTSQLTNDSGFKTEAVNFMLQPTEPTTQNDGDLWFCEEEQ